MQPSELVTEMAARLREELRKHDLWATEAVALAVAEAVALDLYERGLREAAEECACREATALERAQYFGPTGNGWRTHCCGASGAEAAHEDYKRIAMGWRHAADAILSKLRAPT